MAQRSAVEHARRIRESVRRRHGYQSEADIPGPDTPAAIEDAASLARVNAHWGIASDVPVVGRLIVLVRRVMRILLRWYINPIVEQQNAFNDASVRALYELQAENDKLRAELNEMQEQANAR